MERISMMLTLSGLAVLFSFAAAVSVARAGDLPPTYINTDAASPVEQAVPLNSPVRAPFAVKVTRHNDGAPIVGITVYFDNMCGDFLCPGDLYGHFVDGSAVGSAVTNESGVATSPEFFAGQTLQAYSFVLPYVPDQVIDGVAYTWDSGIDTDYFQFMVTPVAGAAQPSSVPTLNWYGLLLLGFTLVAAACIYRNTPGILKCRH